MSLIGREIENHVAENKIDKFEQAGFTKGGKILDNLFILREWVGETPGRIVWHSRVNRLLIDLLKLFP